MATTSNELRPLAVSRAHCGVEKAICSMTHAVQHNSCKMRSHKTILCVFCGFQHVDVQAKFKKLSGGCPVIPVWGGGAGIEAAGCQGHFSYYATFSFSKGKRGILCGYLKLNKEKSDPLSTLGHKGSQVLQGPSQSRVQGKQCGATLALPDPKAATVISEGLWQEAESSPMAPLGTQARMIPNQPGV